MRPDSDQPVTAGNGDQLSPQESLAVIDSQYRLATRSLLGDPAVILAAWAGAWLAGFGALYLASPKGPGPLFPTWAAGLLLTVLFVAAAGVSGREGMWRSRGVDGPARQAGVLYGWSWLLGMGAMTAINVVLENRGVPPEIAPLLWSGSSLLVVGLLFLAAGMIWSDRVQYGLGVWTLVIGAVSVSVGVPANYAVLAVAGGGGMLVAAALVRATGTHPGPWTGGRRHRPIVGPPGRQ